MYSKKEPTIDTSSEKISAGVYLLVDQHVNEKISGFIRYGTANSQVSNIESDLGIGILWKAPFASRKNDKLSFGVTQANAGGPYANANPNLPEQETTFELTYKSEFLPGLFVQPDLQYVTNQINEDLGKLDPALAGSIRLEMNF